MKKHRNLVLGACLISMLSFSAYGRSAAPPSDPSTVPEPQVDTMDTNRSTTTPNQSGTLNCAPGDQECFDAQNQDRSLDTPGTSEEMIPSNPPVTSPPATETGN